MSSIKAYYNAVKLVEQVRLVRDGGLPTKYQKLLLKRGLIKGNRVTDKGSS